MICPPEFIVYKPHPTNNFRWVVEIIDPPSQGVYTTFDFDAGVNKKTRKEWIEYEMEKVYNELGLKYAL